MRSIIALGAAVLASLTLTGPAQPQNNDCARLQQAIAAASRGNNSQSAQFQAAAQRQRGEISRTAVYAQSIGCQNHKFLFLGSDPPAQCEQINAQLSRMQANLAELQAKGGGGEGGREQLVARYNAECAAPAQPRGIFDALFGNQSQQASPDVQTVPLAPEADANVEEKTIDGDTEARAGSKAVCVRSCDGSFFPVSYSAGGSRLDDLQDMCRALCPNAEVSLYTYAPSADIETAVSISGARYIDSPNALKYRKSVDFDLLLPPTRAELGRRVGGRGAKAGRRRQERHHRDAGKIGGAVATQTGPQEQGRQDPGRRVARHNSGRQGGGPGPDPDRPARPAGGDRQPRVLRHRGG